MAQEYVGIDLHRRRSVIYRMDQAGDKIDSVRVENEPMQFAKEVSAAPTGSDVILEATYGWYWAADLLKEMGYRVHLANPHGNDWGHRRVKNDERDARDLADLLRLGRLAEAWIAPPKTRELREMIRFRMKTCNLRTGLKAQVHAVMAKNGILPCRGDMWGPGGAAQFDSLELPDAYVNRIAVLRDIVELYDREIGFLDRDIHRILSDDAGYHAIQAIYGVGPVFAAIFVAEIGDVTRFESPKALCSWAGLTPLHRESDTHVHRGKITKQGSRQVRWAAIEAVARYHGGEPLRYGAGVVRLRLLPPKPLLPRAPRPVLWVAFAASAGVRALLVLRGGPRGRALRSGPVGHDPARFKEFTRRYHAELKQPERSDALAHLQELAKAGTLTLITATKQPEISEAEVLARMLRR